MKPTATSGYMQVITPDDECSVHGRDFMALTRPVAPMWIDGVAHGEPVGHYVCIGCLHANTEREKVRAEQAETKVKDIENVLAMCRAITEDVEKALDGEEVSDFMESFSVVRKARDMYDRVVILEGGRLK